MNATLNATAATLNREDNRAGITGPSLMIHTDVKGALALDIPDGERLIVQNFRNPSRQACVIIPADAWAGVDTIPEQFRGLVSSVLEQGAKSILRRYCLNYSLMPMAIPANLFSADAILSEAAGNNSDWLDADEMAAAWDTSATRAQFIKNPNYAASAEYRKLVNHFAETVKKLAGKKVSIQPKDLDAIAAKIHADDHATEFGQFVFRRIEQLRNRKVAEGFDLALL